MTYNDIGIDSNLDWKRIRRLFIIGLLGGCMTFVGDWLLGYGVYDESLTGLEKKLSQYLISSLLLLKLAQLLFRLYFHYFKVSLF